jgi:tRNA uridine 5-carbamoylmethylation protein Kti12
LLDDKLMDVLLSSENAAESNRWDSALLHIIAYDHNYADRIEDAYATLPGEIKDDTVIVVTVTDGNDDFIY